MLLSSFLQDLLGLRLCSIALILEVRCYTKAAPHFWADSLMARSASERCEPLRYHRRYRNSAAEVSAPIRPDDQLRGLSSKNRKNRNTTNRSDNVKTNKIYITVIASSSGISCKSSEHRERVRARLLLDPRHPEANTRGLAAAPPDGGANVAA